jgi:hypothetical protein
MTSDPKESAAWRAFGMLDSDEATSFDAAARRNPDLAEACREINCLTAAVAAVSVTPLAPKAGQIDRLHARLGLNAAKRTNWIGISGWAAAAVLALILVLDHGTDPLRSAAAKPQPQSAAGPAEVLRDPIQQPPGHPPIVSETTAVISPARDPANFHPPNEVTTIVKSETKRLIQEIEVLREKLESAQDRDRILFQAVPGMAWPVIMKMTPPEVAVNQAATAAPDEGPSALTTLVADALAGAPTAFASADTFRADGYAAVRAQPSAIPIYDAARDTGTLVVNNLPKTLPDESYNLWVATDKEARPIHVGRLPESDTIGADSFDFSLGSKAVVPTRFYLTKDSQERITAPSASNTVLQGPR